MTFPFRPAPHRFPDVSTPYLLHSIQRSHLAPRAACRRDGCRWLQSVRSTNFLPNQPMSQQGRQSSRQPRQRTACCDRGEPIWDFTGCSVKIRSLKDGPADLRCSLTQCRQLHLARVESWLKKSILSPMTDTPPACGPIGSTSW